MNVEQYWEDVLNQDADRMRLWFHPNAYIKWHNTNECFSVEEFVKANCEYPGNWKGEIEQKVVCGERIITALHVYDVSEKNHFHVTSFMELASGKIQSIDEYWGEDGDVPQWRKELHIGKKIEKR